MKNNSNIRLRFCPSPTGLPHVGLIRTALFNWAYAKHVNGTFVFRIEDTDAKRDSEMSYNALLDALKWLNLDWDEGIEVGGPYAPYRQSMRLDIYEQIVKKLLDNGFAYKSYSTADEVKIRHKNANRNENLGYDNYDRTLSKKEISAFENEGRKPVIRLIVPENQTIKYNDLIRGEIKFDSNTVPDFVIKRADNSFLYTLVNPVDDALMKISHVLRGEDLLSSMPRQIVLHKALKEIGVSKVENMEFGHLPYVMGEKNKKLSKRDAESNLFLYRENGYIPEGMLNYLALLGWAISGDNDIFSMNEMVEKFELNKILPNPAKFDSKKCLAINGVHIRILEMREFEKRVLEFIKNKHKDLSARTIKNIKLACPLIQQRVKTLKEAENMLSFLFADLPTFEHGIIESLKKDRAKDILKRAKVSLESIEVKNADGIKQALASNLVENALYKPREAYGTIRTAIAGRYVSPPLFESIEIIGIKNAIERIEYLLKSIKM